MKNYVVIAAIETQRDEQGNVKKLSETFLNNARTFAKDHPNDNVVIIDCRNYMKAYNPIRSMWEDIATSFGTKGIDGIFYNGHSGPNMLYVFSHVRTELPNNQRYLDKRFDYVAKYNADCLIYLLGCQAAGKDGVLVDRSIAQGIADKTGCIVYGYTSRTSQKKRADGGFEQVPQIGGLVKILPN
jgi:hypothetical protein